MNRQQLNDAMSYARITHSKETCMLCKHVDPMKTTEDQVTPPRKAWPMTVAPKAKRGKK